MEDREGAIAPFFCYHLNMRTRLEMDVKIPAKKNKYKIGRGRMYKPDDILAFEDEVFVATREQRCIQIPGKFSISGTYYLTEAADLDNANTTLLDALQLCGVIENDKLNVHIDIHKVTGSGRHGCIVTLTQV